MYMYVVDRQSFSTGRILILLNIIQFFAWPSCLLISANIHVLLLLSPLLPSSPPTSSHFHSFSPPPLLPLSPVANPCSNSQCSDICLLSSADWRNYSCTCEEGVELHADGATCLGTYMYMNIHIYTCTYNKVMYMYMYMLYM